jgi:outer membrane protein TolC
MFIRDQFFLLLGLTTAQFHQPIQSQHEHKPYENTLVKQAVPFHHQAPITMIASRKNILISLLFLLLSASVNAQPVLDQYIADAFNNNLVLKEKKIALDKSLLAIKEARSLFLPTTWFETQYTLAQGGRTINIPIGDLLNPVYNTLNQLTSSSRFPTVQNVNEQFLPNNFYDVRIKTTMPLINPDISINRNIKQQEVQLKENDVLIYKRELAKEIKQAYYNYLMSEQAVNILEGSLELVQQNLRLNQSLLSNGKGLPAYVTRSESEVLNVENQLLSARNSVQNASAYFNFLLNKPLKEKIVREETENVDPQLQTILAAESNINQREELKSIGLASEITGNVLKMNQSFGKPRLNAFLDLASQGFDFKVNRSSFFYLAGIQLQFPIYTGKRNLTKITQTQYDLQGLRLNMEQVQQQLQLAALQSGNNARNAYNAFRSQLKQQAAAAQYFKLMDRGFKEGVNSFIEFLDARNQLTSSQLQLNISKYRFLAGLAEYERQTAGYQIR